MKTNSNIMDFNSLFSNEKVNTGRQKELDIIRVVAIVVMILIHTSITVMNFQNSETNEFLFVLDMLLGSGAAVFILIMGIVMSYSRHNTPNELIRRGIVLLLLGFFVNIGEYILPHFLSCYLFNDASLVNIYNGVMLFYVDILGFASMALILMGILRKLKISNKHLLLLAIAMSLIGSFVRCIDFNNPVLNTLLGYFIATNYLFTAFPLFVWFIFPAVGYVYGQYYIRCKDKSRFFKYWPLFIIIGSLYFLITIFTGGYMSSDETYYFLNTLDVIFILIDVHGLFGLGYVLSKKLPEAIVRFLTLVSKNLTRIYIAQWFLIPVTVILTHYFLPEMVFSDLTVVLLGMFLIVISVLVAFAFNKVKKLD